MFIQKIKSLFLINLYILSISSLFHSCIQPDEFVGPAICPSPTFAISTSSFATLPSNVDLSLTPLNLTAIFTESISWTITIMGENGALRKYSDNTKDIYIEWRGEPGNSTFFEDGEVIIEFKIACRDPFRYPVTIKANDFNNYSASGKGVLISGFDGNGIVNNTYRLLPDKGSSPEGWGSYYSVPQNELTEFAIHLGALSHRSPADQYFTIKGQAGPGYWSCGGSYAEIDLSTISSNADNTYFNALINRGNNPNTILAITLQSNGGNYTKMVNLDWVGWKLVSFKFSEFEKNGLPLIDVANTSVLEFGLNCATAPGQLTEANLDFIIITAGEPLPGE